MTVSLVILLVSLVVYGLSFRNLYRARRHLALARKLLDTASWIGKTVDYAIGVARIYDPTTNGERVQ